MINLRDSIFTASQWLTIHERLGLPPRQRQVIEQLFQGHSDKQIAEGLGIAIPTVRTHLQRLYDPLLKT
jgi:DNA-binding NarL/FixJ family response regulator